MVSSDRDAAPDSPTERGRGEGGGGRAGSCCDVML